MKKMSHNKELEKLRGSQSSKATPAKKRPSFGDGDLIENQKKNYPNTASREFSTNVSLSEHTLNEFHHEGIA